MRSGTTGNVETRTTVFDRIHGFVIAGSLVFGAWSLLLLLFWLTREVPSRDASTEIFKGPYPTNFQLTASEVSTQRAAEPGVENRPELEPERIVETVSAFAQIPSSLFELLAAHEARVRGPDGTGGSRPSVGIDWVGRMKSVERWMVAYEADDESSYVAQLRAFGIELGAVHATFDQIELVSLESERGTSRKVRRTEERRVYFVPNQGKIANFDRKLARNAGLDLQNKILVQFYPKSTTARLMQLELEAAKVRGLDLAQVRRTLFKIRTGTQGFEYYVAAMEPKIPAGADLSLPSR